MRKPWLACLSLLLACGKTENPRDKTSDAAASTSAVSATSTELIAVQVDRTTFEETRLGKLGFESKPPFKATVIDGDEPLRRIVAEMNALDHVMSAGLIASPPQRVERSSDEFFRIMRYGWLKKSHGIALRLPAKGTPPPRRYELVTVDGKKNVPLATVAIDDVHYLKVVAGPSNQRDRVGALLGELNERSGESVRTAPPPGERGSYGRSIERGTPQFFSITRDKLLQQGALLVPEGRRRPDELTVEGRAGRRGGTPARYWLSVHVPGTFTVVPPAAEEHIHLSGPQGGPLGVRVVAYRDVAYDAASLNAFVLKRYGTADGFSAGSVAEVELAARPLLAMTFQTGRAVARAAHLVALWPVVHHLHAEDAPTRQGIAIELTASGGDPAPSALQILAQPDLATVVDSLYVDHDGAL